MLGGVDILTILTLLLMGVGRGALRDAARRRRYR